MTRRICYVSGTRADFGLMQSALQAIHRSPDLRLDVLVTGMHLSAAHGYTVSEICSAGLTIRGQVPLDLEPATGATMARNIGQMIWRFVDELEVDRPDFVLLLGDRGEMLAGAVAAIHLNVPAVHIHGGERSGTVDEPVRHAISKLAHYHFVATDASRERLVRMGESAERVFVTGAPGLDGLEALADLPRDALCRSEGLDETRPLALMVFHPVLQEAESAGESARTIMESLASRRCQVVALLPNSDAGSSHIREVLLAQQSNPEVRLLTHLPRAEFASWMACCDVLIGNSSAGIIEAATFGTPVLNLGCRQNLRERNANTLDVRLDKGEIIAALDRALSHGRFAPANVYGDGKAGPRIVDLLSSLPIDADLMAKTNAY